MVLTILIIIFIWYYFFQGKSRSATAVVAYLIAAKRGRTFEESLKIVQEQRKMAEPNPTFFKKLQEFARSNALKEVQEELLSTWIIDKISHINIIIF